jgi:lysophospholipase L1-like esterase
MIGLLLAATLTTAPQSYQPTNKLSNERWAARYAQITQEIQAKQPDILFLGDSITEGWEANPNEWKALIGPYTAVNAGIASDGIQHMLWRVQNGNLGRPKLVVVLAGINNLVGEPESRVARGVNDLVEAIRIRSPTSKIILLGIFPCRESPTNPIRTKIRSVNYRLDTVAIHHHITFMDIGDFFLDDGHLLARISRDSLHLTRQGYRRFVEALWPTMERILKE